MFTLFYAVTYPRIPKGSRQGGDFGKEGWERVFKKALFLNFNYSCWCMKKKKTSAL